MASTSLADLDIEAPTLIEGLPGHGLVASIAVDHIVTELDLSPVGGIRTDEIPPVMSFADGRVHDTVRVAGGTDPAILTLRGDVMLPAESHRPFSTSVLSDLADRIDRGIFLAAAPAKEEDEHGTILGVATEETMQDELEGAGVELAAGTGLVGGVTGALVNECYRRDIPAALLLVRADPLVPDPEAAQRVIDEALEPLVDFDIDTGDLLEQADEIQQRKAQVARQLAATAGEDDEAESAANPAMFQ